MIILQLKKIINNESLTFEMENSFLLILPKYFCDISVKCSMGSGWCFMNIVFSFIEYKYLLDMISSWY